MNTFICLSHNLLLLPPYFLLSLSPSQFNAYYYAFMFSKLSKQQQKKFHIYYHPFFFILTLLVIIKKKKIESVYFNPSHFFSCFFAVTYIKKNPNIWNSTHDPLTALSLFWLIVVLEEGFMQFFFKKSVFFLSLDYQTIPCQLITLMYLFLLFIRKVAFSHTYLLFNFIYLFICLKK